MRSWPSRLRLGGVPLARGIFSTGGLEIPAFAVTFG